MTDLQIFKNNEFGEVRVTKEGDEVWFVGKDVAKILGYKEPRSAVSKKVDKEDKGVAKMETPSGVQKMTIINESGLYSLILGSKLPSAKKFKHWVTNEILPTIRKTGGYVANDETFIENYLPFADEGTKTLFRATLKTVREQNELIKEQTPKVEHYNKVLHPGKLITITDIAKDLSMSGRALNKELNERKVIYKSSNCWKPYASYEWLVPEYADYEINEHGQNLKWTEKGREWIMNFLNK